ncbi:MAG: MBL fold metallo-hydrolase, partial [Halobacteriaceae archaeon]
DVPELVWYSLNREEIDQVDYIFLSHFHADHTLGLRTVQPLGLEEIPITDFIGKTPTLVTSETTYERAIEANDVFRLLTDQWADITLLGDGESIQVGDLELTHIGAEIEKGEENAISGFLFNDNGTNVFISPDENRHFELDQLPDLDLWIKETGYFRRGPNGESLVTETAEETGLQHEMTFEESIEQVRKVEPSRTVFTEIEELFRRSFDDYQRLEEEYTDLNVQFAFDGMEIHVE